MTQTDDELLRERMHLCTSGRITKRGKPLMMTKNTEEGHIKKIMLFVVVRG